MKLPLIVMNTSASIIWMLCFTEDRTEYVYLMLSCVTFALALFQAYSFEKELIDRINVK